MTIVRMMIITSLAVLAIAGVQRHARAAEIVFMCAPALHSSMDELLPEFQRASGHTVKVSYTNLGTTTQRLRKGEVADLAIVSPQQWDALQKDKIVSGPSATALAKVGVGVFVKKGVVRPNIVSANAFKAALVNARMIAVRNPQEGSPVGAHVVPLLERLGIDKAKVQLTSGNTGSFDAIARGDADVAFAQVSEIIAAAADTELVGPLPDELQNFTRFVAATPIRSTQGAAATSLLEFLRSPWAASVLKSKGLEPG